MKLKEILDKLTSEEIIETEITIFKGQEELPFKEWRFNLFYEVKKILYLGDSDSHLQIYI